MPKISIVIPCYNQGKFLKTAVDSVFVQTYKDWEIIIVNDGSTDNSLEIIDEILTRENVNVFAATTPDVGSVAARMAGINESKGEYYVPLDADDFLHPEYLSKMADVLDNDDNIGFAYCDSVYVKGNEAQRFNQPEYSFHRLLEANFISYCSMFRMELLRDPVTSYNTKNWGYYEDYELYIRLGRKGYYGKHLAEPLFYHTIHESNLSSKVPELDQPIRCKFVEWYPELYSRDIRSYAKQIVSHYDDNFLSKKPKDIKRTK